MGRGAVTGVEDACEHVNIWTWLCMCMLGVRDVGYLNTVATTAPRLQRCLNEHDVSDKRALALPCNSLPHTFG